MGEASEFSACCPPLEKGWKITWDSPTLSKTLHSRAPVFSVWLQSRLELQVTALPGITREYPTWKKKKKIQTQNTENIFYWIHTAFAPSESLKIIKVSPDTPGIFRTINRVTFLTPEDLRRHPFLSSLWYSPVCRGTQTTYIPFLREGYAWETQGIVFIVLIPCNWK